MKVGSLVKVRVAPINGVLLINFQLSMVFSKTASIFPFFPFVTVLPELCLKTIGAQMRIKIKRGHPHLLPQLYHTHKRNAIRHTCSFKVVNMYLLSVKYEDAARGRLVLVLFTNPPRQPAIRRKHCRNLSV